MEKELFELYKRNFPFNVRAEETVLAILGNVTNDVIIKRNKEGKIIGASVINQNTVLLICVDEEYRNKGIGTELLQKSEEVIKCAGYREMNIGAGYDYLMPGVPTNKGCGKSEYVALYPTLNDNASRFFAKRGYYHSWDCDCFDMRVSLAKCSGNGHSVGDIINGVQYRWATMEDLEEVCKCTDDAYEEFTQWYRDKNLYSPENCARVLIATENGEVVGTLIVSKGAEEKNLGSAGCTTVRTSCRGRHIAVNLVTLGTQYLKDCGLEDAFLGYTYTGLDYLYGKAGYKVCVYYMMAKKELGESL